MSKMSNVYTHYYEQATIASAMWEKLLAKPVNIESILSSTKGGTMSGIIAITNPSDESAEAGIVEEIPYPGLTPRTILERYGSKLEDGAQVVMTNIDNSRVWQYIATRETDGTESIALRSNNGLAREDGDQTFIQFVAAGPGHGEFIIEVGDYELERPEPPVELETFTVYGENDDDERFVAVVSATEDTVREAGIKAGLVDEGYEADVRIDLILKGDQTDLEVASV
jgi:hypothetical protein